VRWLADLGHILRRDLQRVVCNPVDLNRYLVEFYGVQRSIQKAKDAKLDTSDGRGILNFEQLLELGKSGDIGADDRHVVHIVDWLLQYAFEQRASDIHLEPRRDTSPIRFRIDGIMHKVFELPTPVMMAVTARVKILGRMDLAEKRRPQDGRIKTRSSEGREVELRLSTMPTAFGEKVVLRIFDPDIVVKEFRQLGFSGEEETIWRALVERPHGIVLVTGPTGSGKTTTLYSTLKHLATPDINVCTVEDPIEMVSPELNQMQVQSAIDLDFATGVRTLLRQDPDIIMIGEIRDLQTAQMAIQASLTGHLVLSTLHTNDAPSAITRLLDLGAPHYLIQSTLAGVVAQRLIRTLCPALQGRGSARRARLGRAGASLGLAAAGARLRAEGLPGMPQHRVPRPHRHLRDDAHFAASASSDPAGGRHGKARPGGVERGHAPAAHLRSRAGCARHHDDCRGGRRIAAAGRVTGGVVDASEALRFFPRPRPSPLAPRPSPLKSTNYTKQKRPIGPSCWIRNARAAECSSSVRANFFISWPCAGRPWLSSDSC
jgi:type II secretory ATPase GspE/PulE/Tfp pilus assembly ATPase PilB-like protein